LPRPITSLADTATTNSITAITRPLTLEGKGGFIRLQRKTRQRVIEQPC
jgi:hypothetical protein